MYCVLALVVPVKAQAESELHQGIVIEKFANVKTVEAWHAPSDPYYVLELMDAASLSEEGALPDDDGPISLLLRPSETVPTEELQALQGNYVIVKGAYTEGEEYTPSDPAESFPIEHVPGTKGESHPIKRGAGFVVTTVIIPFLYDNGPDAFADGLARFGANDKIGFFNESGGLIIPARFDFALPFSEGLAAFCSGCRKVQDGEHSRHEGGQWGYIDLTGNAVIAPQYSEARSFEGGEAQVKANGEWIVLPHPQR